MNLDVISHCFSCGKLAGQRYLEGRERLFCQSCDLILYQNPKPAAAVLLLRQNQILLVKRAMEPQKGLWALPAGFQELDETPEEAARREMHEETGLKAGKLKLLDLIYNNHNPLKPVNVAIYLAEEAEGQLTAGDDVSQAYFFPINQLPTQLAFNYIHDCLRKCVTLSPVF